LAAATGVDHTVKPGGA